MRDRSSSDATFADRVAIVTGAGRGIGLEVADPLARGGASVALVDRDAEHVGGGAELVRRSGRQKRSSST